MEIIVKKDLSKNEMEHIREMIDYNNMLSKLDLDIMIDNNFVFSKELTTNFLAYKSNKLVGYAHIFAPSNDTFEVQTMVSKDYERIRINTKLLDYVKREAEKFKPKNLLLVCDESSVSGMHYIQKIGAKYSHSEYFMKLRDDYEIKYDFSSDYLSIKAASLEDLDDYLSVSKTIYDSHIDNLRDRFTNLFSSPDRKFYILYKDAKAIGIGSIVLENYKNMLYGFGIVPEERGKSYSKFFLNKILETTIKDNKNKIYLEVDSTNQIAYSLYKTNGFSELRTISYFNIEY